MAPKAEDRFDSLFIYYAHQYDIPDWHWLKALVKQESQFDPMARSTDGAAGLAQLRAQTFNEWAIRLGVKSPNPYDPEKSIQCEAGYFRWLLDNFHNNVDRALGAYSAFGVANEMLHKQWPLSTQTYVAHVKRYFDEYTGHERN